GQFSDAVAAAQKAVEVQPADFANHQQLGSLYMLMGRYQDPVPVLQTVVELAPNLGAAHKALGAALGSVGRLEDAEKELRTAGSFEDLADNEHTLGAILLDLGKNPAATQCFLRARELGARDALFWLNLGLSYSRQGLEPDAKIAFRNGIEAAQKRLI